MLSELQVEQIIEDWVPYPDDLEKQIREIALLHSRYLFFRKGKAVSDLDDLTFGTKPNVYYGFCTHCQKQSPLAAAPSHNGIYLCPGCGSICIAKKSGLSTKRLFDDTHFNLVQVDHNRIFIRQLWVNLDYRGDKLHPQLNYRDEGYRWLLSAEGCYKLVFRTRHTPQGWRPQWGQQKSFTVDQYYADCSKVTSRLLEMTYLKNSHAYEYMKKDRLNDLIQYADAFTKHPSIDSLVNEKTLRVAREYIEGNRAVMNRIIDWKRSRPHEMLRVQKDELPRMIELFGHSPLHALCYQRVRLAKQQLTTEQWNLLSIIPIASFSERPIRESIKNGRIVKMLNYLQRQLDAAQAINAKSRYQLRDIVTLWRDYLDECTQLGYPLHEEATYYPGNLVKQHERTMRLIQMKKDDLSRQKAADRVEKLRWMAFEKDGFLIRPAESANELSDEGKFLHHCVASYAERYVNGKTALFLIRRSDDPARSFFTLELDESRLTVRQNRGDRNCAPPTEVVAFVEQWLEWLPIEQKRLKKLQRQLQKTA